MITDEEFELWKERIDSEDLDSYDVRMLVKYCSSGPAVSIGLSKDDTIKMTEAVNKLWTKYKARCKNEIVRRIKTMMLKFIELGEHGIKAMHRFCKLSVEGNIKTRENVESFCIDYKDSPRPREGEICYFNTWHSAEYAVSGRSLYVHMEDWFRGEVEETDYEIPLEYLDEDFKPIENKKIHDYIKSLELDDRFWATIPMYPTATQKKAFLNYLEDNPSIKDKLAEIFWKE